MLPEVEIVKGVHGDFLCFRTQDFISHAIRRYGVWGEKSLYGKTYMGIVRTTFLIDRAGEIARVWPKVRIAGHVDEVLAAARAL